MKLPSILKPSKKKIIILAVLLILGFVGLKTFGTKKPSVLHFAQVRRENINSIVSSSGSLTGKNTANLKFKSSGKLSFINVKVGDPVKQYQIIAGLDTRDLNITLQQAYNTLRDKEAAKEKAEDDVKGHDSDETFAQKVTRTAAEVAKDNAFDNVKAAQKTLDDAVLISPIDGIVTQAFDVPGQNVSTVDLITQIVDSSKVYFDTDVDEADIGKISLNMSADITLDAYPDKIFKGIVDQIIPQTKTTSSGATVVTVRIKLTDIPGTFVNDLSGDSSIITETVTNVMAVPIEALRDDNSVVVKTTNGLVAKKVMTGIQSDNDIEIKEGLTENDQVLLNPPAVGEDLSKIK